MTITYSFLSDTNHVRFGEISVDLHGNYVLENTTPGARIVLETNDGSLAIIGDVKFGNYIMDARESVSLFSTPDDITFTDQTSKIIRPGSQYTTFDGSLIAGSIDYIGSDIPIRGFTLKTDVLANPGTGAVAREYWNGSAWIAFTSQATDAEAPYTHRGDNFGTVVGTEQVRFGSADLQVKTTISGVNKYWIRFRITSAITTCGIVDTIYTHGNGYKISDEGFTEYFGTGIYPRDLTMHWDLTEELATFSPSNQNIVFASGLELVYADNKYDNAKTDGRGGYVIIPEGMDTSKGLEIEVLFIPLDNTAGDIYFEAATHQASIGSVIDATNVAPTINGAHAIPLNNLNTIQQIIVNYDTEALSPGGMLAFGIKRLGADALDTYTGNIAVINIRIIGRFWKP